MTQFQKEGGDEVEVPVLYDAITFSPTERKYPTYKRELFVLITLNVHKFSASSSYS